MFTLNGTDALNLAIKGAARPGDHVVYTAADHNSVRRPVHALTLRGVVTSTCVSVDGAGVVDPDEVRRAITRRTRLVALPHASNVTGAIQPVRDVIRAAHEHDALVLLDAAQTAGVLDLDPSDPGADLVAFPGHKALRGPTGVGVLYVGSRAELQPLREGGTGAESDSPLPPEALPARLEAGTPNTVGIAGLSAALDGVRPEAALAHERALLRRLVACLDQTRGIHVLGPADVERRVGVLSLTIEGIDPQDAAAILDESFDIAVRAGLHCAPNLHRALGTYPAGALRASFGVSNTEAEVDALAEALKQIAAQG
ncbi:MAG: Cysteine desulfurase SufS [Phycisphaerae bacterium]|nr:Cysteine desulfurase SufS [Phycisphaerae bacterium]